MGKRKNKRTVKRHSPLTDDILSSRALKLKKKQKEILVKEPEENYIPKDLSSKILKEARDQQREIEGEEKLELSFDADIQNNPLHEDNLVMEEIEDHDFESDDGEDFNYEGLDEEEAQALENFFMGENAMGGAYEMPLGEVIASKIAQYEETQRMKGQKLDEADITKREYQKKLKECFREVGEVMKKYRSGKVPKALKILPNMKDWEKHLQVADVSNWTPAAIYAATRLFSSNLPTELAQQFYTMFLLPHVRDDIMESGKLNYHYYQALRKALFKPAAFFKGIIIPLCAGGDCTVKEAIILSSILSKVSIPVLHSAAALKKISELPSSPAGVLFIKALIGKGYNLPSLVVSSLVEYFHSFIQLDITLPVSWHQSLLDFIRKYGNHLTEEERERLREVIRVHNHHLVTQEIRQSLFAHSS